jgi:hypothetical protein
MHRGGVIYKLGEITKPVKGAGPLCVFTSEREASRFIGRGRSLGYLVYRVKYKPSKRQGVWKPDLAFARSRRKVDFVELSLLPIGTVLATQVLLLEEVK